MSEDDSARNYLDGAKTLDEARMAATTCRGCPLYKLGTQTVFGEGPLRAKIIFVGEQPGDKEDKLGRPFVGPAGRVLDNALEAAGIDRSCAYVTNAVKHFKWEPKGKRRLHKKPSAREIAACKPWLEAEIGFIKPRIVVALGATAAQDMMGRTFKVTQQRGQVFEDIDFAPAFMATVHPSSILRGPSSERNKAFARFTEDISGLAPFVK